MNEHVKALLLVELGINRSNDSKFKAYDLLSEYADGLLRTELEALAALYISMNQHINSINGRILEIKKKIELYENELKEKYK